MRHVVLTGPRGNRWSVEVPEGRAERMRGLLGRSGLQREAGLLLERTRSIHTFRMRFAILAAFLDGGNRVVGVRRMPPGRIALPRGGVRSVLELPQNADVRRGDRLCRSP